MKLLAILAFFLGFTSLTLAQSPVDDMVKDWERAKAFTKEYLDAMPADKYNLKPTPEMRSFAQQMLHLADANYGFIAAATGLASPVGMGASEKAEDQSKENTTKLVMASYDFVIGSIKTMTPEKLAENTTLFGRFEMSKGKALEKAFEHQTHHRGQATVYIRLGGATPPQEKLF
ncbi:DinB family protein [Algoriphagus aestuariicola]|jgi:uncharacterized damage-inducible protein DinB|uniref:DinB family protein n=1 Tax=Algoriphagus aestuariicola TaxID=1852016 RepID=A0ABS3BQ78_9BACT|nr:DinB family protein [Algoriphagus aestuariicola]MBN7801444.1 DinB family protein [Algoriphagus aestuariicola]